MVCKRYTEEQIIQVVREMSRAYSEKDCVRSGIMAGVIAGIVMTIFMMIATATAGKGLLAFPQMIGESFLKGQPAVVVTIGGLLGQILSSAIFGILWAYIWRYVAKGGLATVVGGLIYGLLISVVMSYLVLPALKSPIAQSMPVGMWYLAHMVYGFVLALRTGDTAKIFGLSATH